MKKNIIVKLQYDAIHRWENCNISDVFYLKYPHRHIFYITAKKTVNHNDRDIEIITFKKDIEDFLNVTYNHDFITCSCEDIAQTILLKFNLSYCSVLEDNENGAEIWED